MRSLVEDGQVPHGTYGMASLRQWSPQTRDGMTSRLPLAQETAGVRAHSALERIPYLGRGIPQLQLGPHCCCADGLHRG